MSKIGRPFGNRVLVQNIEHEKHGEIILSGIQSQDGRFVKGVIVAVGSPIPNLAGIERDPGLAEGDVILYNINNAVKINIPGDRTTYHSMSYNEILHIFDEKIENIQVVNSGDLVPRTTQAFH